MLTELPGYELVPLEGLVVPAQAATHIPETVVMGPRLRGDDNSGWGADGEGSRR
jgi:hypothetical protein